VSDAALAGLLLALSVYDLASHGLGGTYPHGTWAHLPFLVACSVPVAFRRRAPLVALVSLAVLQTVWVLTLYPLDVQPPLIPFVQALIVVYSAGAYTDGRAARAAVAVVAVAALTDIPTLLAGKPLGLVAGPDTMLVIAFALGLGFARIRREREAHQERALRLELERDHAVLEAATAERTRIARELHDVVSHDVSLMVLQASVERRANPGDASAAALASIETTGREALAELRRMLGVLRQEGEAAPLAPQPGLGEVPLLVAQACDAGLPVTLVMDPTAPELPPGLGIASYRIVQEALTNSAKHAPGAPVTVKVRAADGRLDIEVTNDVAAINPERPAPLPSGGQGLVGMRERVAVFGGTLDARPRPAGGFRVHARLPLPAG
jgi:signal transduction histidine kinase